MNLNHDPEVIDQSWNCGCQCNFHVRNACHIHHQKSSRSHNGREDGSTGRGCRFYRACEIAAVSQPFHQGDGDAPGGDDIGSGAPAHGPVKRTGNDSHFGRPADLSSGNGRGKAKEKVAAAGQIEDLAEEDEHVYIGAGYADGCPENSVKSIGHPV